MGREAGDASVGGFGGAFGPGTGTGFAGNCRAEVGLGDISLSVLRKLRVVFSAYLAALVSGTGAALLGGGDGAFRVHGVLGGGVRVVDQRLGFGPHGGTRWFADLRS